MSGTTSSTPRPTRPLWVQDLGCLWEALPPPPREMKTFSGRVKVTLMLACLGTVPRISLNMVAEPTLHKGTITAEKTERLARRDLPREPVHHLGGPLENPTKPHPSKETDRSRLEKGEDRTGEQLEYPGKVREWVLAETTYQSESTQTHG